MTRHVTVALHKPYGFLSRFTSDGSAHRTLAELGLPADVWPIGRLDADSEGLLVLSSDKALVARLLDPAHAHWRTYIVQVERVPDATALRQLEDGVVIDGKPTLRAHARLLPDDAIGWPRDPPIRFRKKVPTAFVALALTEGRNRQVRRMTAAVGHPTLRLVRVAIGELLLGDLAPGAHRVLDEVEMKRLLARPRSGLVLP
jgi:23S rRNA pseudouridine2457 synthase